MNSSSIQSLPLGQSQAHRLFHLIEDEHHRDKRAHTDYREQLSTQDFECYGSHEGLNDGQSPNTKHSGYGHGLVFHYLSVVEPRYRT